MRAFVLTAEGTTNFSVGMNLKELGGTMKERGPDAFFDQRLRVISRIETMGKPSVATLFGYCLGGGLELPLGCTFRMVAAEGAAIGLLSSRSGGRSSTSRRSPGWGVSGQREEARDAGVVGTEIVHQHAGDGLDVEGAGRLHLLEVGPVLGAVEEGLEHREVAAREEREDHLTERFQSDPGADIVVERGRVEEDVDRGRVPPQPRLAAIEQFLTAVFGVGHRVGECGQHVVGPLGWQEDVHVDVDGAPRPLRAPCQRERTAEGLGPGSIATVELVVAD